MIKYKKKHIDNINDDIVDETYKELLDEKWQFIIMETAQNKYVLTKEKSVFEIKDEVGYIDDANRDEYYHTERVKEKVDIEKRLDVFREYMSRYRELFIKNVYGDKYIFGSIAVRIDDKSFITTIRGKEDLSEYTIVRNVDHQKHTIYVCGKKATLNAPLLAHLFENSDVDVIVHINHYFDSKLKYQEYAFPGTVKDSIRDNQTSFNIKYHGVIYLFDKKGNKL
ncbi:MAG: hypothetical protein OSJ70_02665 [Bacilli bacterium]|nr:hypothetical protein [Bacilli bacterium]